MPITSSQKEEFARLVKRWMPDKDASDLRILEDSTDFFNVDYGDILLLNQTPYLIRHNAREVRFGMDDVKYWVKRSVDLYTDAIKIIKLVFHEAFTCSVGSFQFECFRSPKKEARILKLVAGHPDFMQGFAILDNQGNVVRVIDYIYGPPLSTYVENIRQSHESYFYELFPEILDNFMECIRAIRFLHDHGEKHGDIRRDHILIDQQTMRYRWIDFDYNYRHRENIYGFDLFGLGNILIFLAGKGDVLISTLRNQDHPALKNLRDDDMNIVFNNRVADLKKIYPYIPESLNQILCHFAKGANWHYENTHQLLEDLEAYRAQAF